MKKVICMIIILLMTFNSGIPAYAANSTGGTTTITTSVGAAYTVTIPESTRITFNVLSNSIGNIAVTQARLEPGEKITVSAVTDGKLKNNEDDTATIAYTLKSDDTAFTSADFTSIATKALTIDITQAEWDSAKAGSYTGTITFTVHYSGGTP